MQIAGLQKTTLVDFPGKVAATIFTCGCPFRCGFCHNPELVIPEQFNPLIPEEDIFSFLKNRVGKLQGICITGGEPTIQKDISQFIKKIKELGFLVKLDTNGSHSEKLRELINSGNIDYIAMDIKSPLHKYEEVTNIKSQISNLKSNNITDSLSFRPRELCQTVGEILQKDPPTSAICHSREDGNLASNISQSINLIMESGIDYEFRTTVCHPLHTVEDFKEIGELIKGAKRYYIQNYIKSKQINTAVEYEPFADEELEKAKEILEKYIKKVNTR